ncbi:hypothetical protein [Mixta hanseatica]|uniref:Uncharacterized protein n=1 Tax=Mixta hanseatica TaxID=2872648 RepID=A0ABY4R7G2_9GAMM|nr:hypothetical protein [Mixta hanseatica]UQY42746.1 hypothetical protein K6958_12440 [Mixta hanseatica]
MPVIVAIPFAATAMMLLLLAYRQKHKAFLITGYVSMISAVVNLILGFS